MQEQTTPRPTPQPARREGLAENVFLVLGAAAVLVVLACADTPAAAAYRATLHSMVGG